MLGPHCTVCESGPLTQLYMVKGVDTPLCAECYNGKYNYEVTGKRFYISHVTRENYYGAALYVATVENE